MRVNRGKYTLIRRRLILTASFLIVVTVCEPQAAHSDREVRQVQEAGSASASLGSARQAHAGETCVVCRQSVGSVDRVYVVDGQRTPVHAGNCDSLLKRDPGRYLASLRPRGAFLGAVPGAGLGGSPAWLIAACYVLLGLVFGGLCSYRALNRGFNPLHWFLAGLFLNVLAFMLLLTRRAERGRSLPGILPHGLSKIPATYAPRPCPGCGKLNHPAAGSCARCGRRLDPEVASEMEKAGLLQAGSSERSGI